MVQSTYRLPLPALALSVLPGLFGCQGLAADDDSKQEVGFLVASGQYIAAVEVAHAKVLADPADLDAQEQHRLATVAVLLDWGRQLSFLNYDEEALESFYQADDLGPELEQPGQWIARTRDKLSTSWFERGTAFHATENLRAARGAYQMALMYRPSLASAQAAIDLLDKELRVRDSKAEDYYNEGISYLYDGDLETARSRFSYAQKYARDGSRPNERLGEVRGEISRRRVLRAQELEAQGFFAGARTEYLSARQADVMNAEAQDGLERMYIEAEVEDVLKRGEMWILRGDYEQAMEVLQSGRSMTKMQSDAFDQMLAQLDEASADRAYTLALNLERDYRLDQALIQFEGLLMERDFYLDTRSRIDSLRARIASVEDMYASLDSQMNLESRVRVLRSIDSLWPGYRDTRSLLEQAERAQKGGGQE